MRVHDVAAPCIHFARLGDVALSKDVLLILARLGDCGDKNSSEDVVSDVA